MRRAQWSSGFALLPVVLGLIVAAIVLAVVFMLAGTTEDDHAV